MLLSQNRKTEMAENSETGLCMVDDCHCPMLTCAIRIVFRAISLCWKEEKLHSGVRLLSGLDFEGLVESTCAHGD